MYCLFCNTDSNYSFFFVCPVFTKSSEEYIMNSRRQAFILHPRDRFSITNSIASMLMTSTHSKNSTLVIFSLYLMLRIMRWKVSRIRPSLCLYIWWWLLLDWRTVDEGDINFDLIWMHFTSFATYTCSLCWHLASFSFYHSFLQ